MTESLDYNPDPYPNKGYLFDRNGYHSGGEYLNNREELYAWLHAFLPIALATGQELMVTDNLDACIFQAKHGRIVWPNDEMKPPSQEGDST